MPRRKKIPSDPRFTAYPDAFLICRVDRHELPSIDAPDEAQRWRYPDADVLEVRRTCVRCGSVQVRMTNEQTGEIYRPTRYDYADGYQVVSTEDQYGPVPRAASRLEQTRRWLGRHPLPQTKRR